MGIDTSIYNNLLRPPKSVAEYDAEAMQGQQNRLALQSTRMQMEAQQRGVERGNRLTNMLGSFAPGMSAADQGDTLTRGGFIDEGRKVIESGAKVSKDQREGEKAQREAEKFQFEQARDQMGFINQIIGSARDQATYSQGRQAMAARGMDVSQIPEQYDPAYVAAAGQQTMTELQRIDDVWKAKKFDLDVNQFGETVRNNKEQTSVQVRGQNMTSATAAAGRAQSERASLRSDDRARDFNATRSEEVKAKTAIGKAPTEFQGKSAAFGARADQADKIITSLEGKYRPGAIATKQALGKAWVIGGALEAGGNMLIGENEQKAEQAQRDFINAVLRQESGAAIGESEFENAKRQYFAATGDTKATLRQKAENRRLAVKGFKSNAGRAQFDTDAAAPGADDDIHAQAAKILGGK